MSAIRTTANSHVMRNNLHILMIIMPIVHAYSTTIVPWPGPEADPKHRMSKPLDKSDSKYFDSVVERVGQGGHPNLLETTPRNYGAGEVLVTADHSYEEIKALLGKVLEQIEEIKRRSEISQMDKDKVHARATPASCNPTTCKVNPTKKDDAKTARPREEAKEAKEKESKKANAGAPAGASKWGHWTEWSSCSVSCGKGRQIRWRHCIDHCEEAETEMEEKTCQLPACSPAKLFGVIKI